MNWKIKSFFPLLDSFRHKDILPEDGLPPWQCLDNIGGTIGKFIVEVGDDSSLGQIPKEISVQTVEDDEGRLLERMILVLGAVRLKTSLIFRDLGIYIGKGTILEPTAVIKSPAIIGDRCEIRQGAYLRGHVIVGDCCTIGHVTEMKNSIMMNHSEAGHFAYVGDSIIGSYVNLGAGTKLANLQFRTAKAKEHKEKADRIKIIAGEEILETGRRKFGAVIGDYSELGCNSVTSPGTILGQSCWVYPNVMVRKGVYSSMEIIES